MGEGVKCPECVIKVFPSDSEAGPQKEVSSSMPGQAPVSVPHFPQSDECGATKRERGCKGVPVVG